MHASVSAGYFFAIENNKKPKSLYKGLTWNMRGQTGMHRLTSLSSPPCDLKPHRISVFLLECIVSGAWGKQCTMRFNGELRREDWCSLQTGKHFSVNIVH